MRNQRCQLFIGTVTLPIAAVVGCGNKTVEAEKAFSGNKTAEAEKAFKRGMEAGKKGDGKRQLTEPPAVRLRPDYVEAHYYLGYAKVVAKDYESRNSAIY